MSTDHEDPAPSSGSRHERLGLLLEGALAVPQERRGAFVESACAGDATLRDDLLSLIRAHHEAGEFFDRLAGRAVVPVLASVADVSGDDALSELWKSLAGSYRLERELGGGGMSRVYLAEDLDLKRRVVVKVLSPETAPPAYVERFRREIETAASLQHPHIVPLLATGSVKGVAYYTMPFVTGESLSDRLVREGALSATEAVRIWRDVLDALGHAHIHGVIHCDVKPGNILLSGRHALVTDFGIARAIEAAAGRGSRVLPEPAIGTPAYMAPEQVVGDHDLDGRTDIYAAGLVMYEMLAGRPLFDSSRRLDELRVGHVPDIPPLPHAAAGRQLAALVMRCLAWEPEHRPPSAEAVLSELEIAMKDEAGLLPGPLEVSRGGRTHVLRWAAGLLAVAILAATWLSAVRQPGEESLDVDERSRPSLAAFEWYQRGTEAALLRSDSGRNQGIAHFERAIALDSTYVEAWAGLSRMYIQLWSPAAGGARAEWLDRARAAALTAVALDDDAAQAHAALGWVHLASWDWSGAASELERAIALDPVVPRGREGLARVYMMTGRPAEQLEQARLGVASDPLSYSAIREMALALAVNGRCEESLESLAALKNLSPPAGVAGLIRGQCYSSRGRWREAIAEFRWADAHSSTAALAFLGHALARAGETAEAERILSDLTQGRAFSHGSFGIALVHAGMRDYDQAFLWLDRSADDGSMHFYVMHPVLADLHRDPRFQRIRDRIVTAGR
jgi:tetratricopeptide (TPR) repeat protein